VDFAKRVLQAVVTEVGRPISCEQLDELCSQALHCSMLFCLRVWLLKLYHECVMFNSSFHHLHYGGRFLRSFRQSGYCSQDWEWDWGTWDCTSIPWIAPGSM